MGIEKVIAGFLGLHFARTLHKHAGDYLKTVGNPVVKLLKQDFLVLQKVVLDFFSNPRISHIGPGQNQPDISIIPIVELCGV